MVDAIATRYTVFIMAINWTKTVNANIRQIAEAADAIGASERGVCILFDIDNVRAGSASPGLQKIIADTKLGGAVPVTGEGGQRLVCLPISKERTLLTLEEYEDVAELRKRLTPDTKVAVWVICFDGNERTCVDIHAQRSNLN